MDGTAPMDGVTDLPAPWAHEPYLLGHHGRARVHDHWSRGDTGIVVALEDPDRAPTLVGVGEPEAVAAILGEALRAFPAGFVTVPRGTGAHADASVHRLLGAFAEPTAWDWMWTPEPLVGADPSRVRRAEPGPLVTPEVTAFLERAHPRIDTPPGDERIASWWLLRHEGRLAAAVADLRLTPGLAPYLVSLAVDPELRGRGLAGAVLSAAVRDGLTVEPAVGEPMVSLAMYADNHVARRVYERHGFRSGHRFESRRAR